MDDTRRHLKITWRKPIGIRWYDVKMPDGKYFSRLWAKEFHDGMDEIMHAAMPTFEEVKMLTAKFAAREHHKIAAQS